MGTDDWLSLSRGGGDRHQTMPPEPVGQEADDRHRLTYATAAWIVKAASIPRDTTAAGFSEMCISWRHRA
jgi:hypothetical protein